MGDIVLTTPVLRALRNALPDAEIHFLVKPKFAEAIAHNPFLNRLHVLKPRLADTLETLKAEGYTYVVDLQQSLRSRRIRWALGIAATAVDKQNVTKWRMTALKHRVQVPHIVTRYGKTLAPLGIVLDDQGLDFPLLPVPETEALLDGFLAKHGPYLAVALGATHFTKRWPTSYFHELLNQLGMPAVLLGGVTETIAAEEIEKAARHPILNLAGKTSLMGSGHALARAELLITHDTGLMHIGAALGKRIVSLWGNTVPGFGMTPYKTEFIALEIKDLACRPCTKIGYAACPKGHFRCMHDLTPTQVAAAIRARGWL